MEWFDGVMSVAWLRPPTVRLGLAHVADTLAVLLCAVFLWQLFFFAEESFDRFATAVGLVAIAAAILARRRVFTIVDGPVAVFSGLTVLSAIVRHGDFPPASPEASWLTSWKPATDVVVRVVYFYGLSSLLKTERRIGALIAFVVYAASVTGVQTLYDHANGGWGTPIWNYPSVVSWNGYPQIGMVIAIAFSLTMPVLIVSRSAIAMLASSLLALAFVFDLAFLVSRSAHLTVGAAYVALNAVELWKLKTRRLTVVTVVGLFLMAAVLVASPARTRSLVELWDGAMYGTDTRTPVTARFAIWTRAAVLIRAHPWLGVGPGNYTDASRRIPSVIDAYQGSNFNAHAHNMILHVAAESGIPGVTVFLLIWWRIFKRLSGLWSRSASGLLALALSGALFSFFVRSLSDYFMSDGLRHSERMGLLLWTLLGAAVAVVRLPDRTHDGKNDRPALA